MFADYTTAKEETLIGFVYEIEEKGWVKGIGISTGDESYIVEENEWVEKLSREVENDVKVTGFVARDVGSRQNRIAVTGYEVLNLEDPYTSDINSIIDDDS
jgi:hypothetical protein